MDASIIIFVNLFALALISTIDAQFTVEILEPVIQIGKPRKVVSQCDARGALFGGDLFTFTFSTDAIGCVSFVEPTNACGKTKIAHNSTICENNYAIVKRGNCTFGEKAIHVQEALDTNFKLMIVYAYQGDAIIDMSGGDLADKIKIPALMISYDCMIDAMLKYPAYRGYAMQIRTAPGYYDIFRYLVPFIVLVGFCSLVLLVSLIFRLFRERRKIMRKRLSKRNLKKIPTKKYKKGDQPETCAICLEDYSDGEKVRVLPCRHTYHCRCIDPWLTENRKVCPMCKRRVGAPDSDEEADAGTNPGTSSSSAQPSTSTAVTPPPSVSSLVPTNSTDYYRDMDVVINGPESPSTVILRPYDSQALRPSTSQQINEASDDHVVTRDDAFLVERDSDEEDESNEPPMSQSIKNKIKDIFNRSLNSFSRTGEALGASGQVNRGNEEMNNGSEDEMEDRDHEIEDGNHQENDQQTEQSVNGEQQDEPAEQNEASNGTGHLFTTI
ncbi:hypothetical protein WR25_09670 [Diploscapter pachys]|uniref:RING-type domain-containing protein n=1 Tax=Diploscapter pachys TaxID=2018661 RepID=A0A2A2K7Y1_9BILA|nr:hypothetical protein WR25_09670 [Diploscapter pachys]